MKIKYDLKIPASNKTDKQEEGNKPIKLKKKHRGSDIPKLKSLQAQNWKWLYVIKKLVRIKKCHDKVL